jgi:hypothetical protein
MVEISEDDKRLKEIGKRLRQLRINAGYTSAESFGYDHGINRVCMSRAESGKNLTLKTLFKHLSIHRVSLQEFVTMPLDVLIK